MRAVALLLGAGRGDRLATAKPKCFAEILGKPLLAYAVDAVEACPDVEAFAVAVPRGTEDEATRIAKSSGKHLAVVSGGSTRQESVVRAMEAVPDGFEAVLCHDVARPLAPPALFTAVLAALSDADGAVPALPIGDTVKRVNGHSVVETVARDGLVLVQTPQAFRQEALWEAHRAAVRDGFVGTDDAALLERAGFQVAVIAGDPANMKVTHPQDLRMAALLARADG